MNRRVPTVFLALVLIALVFVPPAPAAPAAVKVILGPNDLPEALRAFGLKGDLLASDAGFAALVGGTSRPLANAMGLPLADPFGLILAFVPAGRGGRALTLIGAPSVRIAGKAVPAKTVSVRVEGADVVVRAAASSPVGIPIATETRYAFDFARGTIRITSDIRNAGPGEITGLSFSLGANFAQSYSFTPYSARAFPELNFRVAQRPDHVLAWWNPNPPDSTDRPLPGRLAAGGSHRVSYELRTGTDIPVLLDGLYKSARVAAVRQPIEFRAIGSTAANPKPLPEFPGPVEVIVREPVSNSIFFRAYMDKPEKLSIPLPDGTFAVRANFFPLTRERTFRRTAAGGKEPAAWTVDVPALGTMTLRLRDKRGAAVPGKVSFLGLAPADSPYFPPENPIISSRGIDATRNTVWPGKNDFALALPAGTYLAVASRGPQFTRELKTIEVFAGRNPDLNLTIDRAVFPAGLVTLDPHMHTLYSDGTLTIAERLKSLVAEGIDVAVPTDHNFATDYALELERLGLTGDLAVIPGSEVTAPGGSIHFNIYPFTPKPGGKARGAISVEDDTPAVLFKLAREQNPGAILQVNHPRSSGLGYFLTYKLDAEKAAEAKAPFDMSFDVMEAMNGARGGASNRASIRDWFHFLNRGYAIKITGSSDAHGYDGGETGYSRTYVLYNGKKAKALDQAALVRAVKEGRSFVSNGPIVEVLAGSKTLGDTLTAKRGKVDLAVTVTAAPWMDISEIRVIVNGETKQTVPAGTAGEEGSGVVKYRGRVRLTLDRDSWIVVEAIGRKSLFPALQQRSADGREEGAAVPYALTNPIFVDVNADGKIDPVWPEKIAIK